MIVNQKRINAPGEWGKLVEEWRGHLGLRCTPTTLTISVRVVSQLAVWAHQRTATPYCTDTATVQRYLDELRLKTNAGMVAFHEKVLHNFFRWLVDADHITKSPMDGQSPAEDAERAIQDLLRAKLRAVSSQPAYRRHEFRRSASWMQREPGTQRDGEASR